jgi:hypothetical protein
MKTDLPDVDIEVLHREEVIKLFPEVVKASQIAGNKLVPHNSGIYFQKIPVNPLNGLASFPHHEAEDQGFYKVDLLSCPNPYVGIESMDEIRALLAAPIDWDWFLDAEFVSTLFHFNGIVYEGLTMADVVAYYAPKSINDIAMLIAIKLPAKKHLIGEDWETIRANIWEKEPEGKGKPFKRSHAVAYALVVGIDARRKAPLFFNQPYILPSSPT